jgi:hypothetical protein
VIVTPSGQSLEWNYGYPFCKCTRSGKKFCLILLFPKSLPLAHVAKCKPLEIASSQWLLLEISTGLPISSEATISNEKNSDITRPDQIFRLYRYFFYHFPKKGNPRKYSENEPKKTFLGN